MKEQLAAGLSERQVTELVENNEVDAGEIFGQPPLPAGAGLALQPVHQVDDGIEAAPGAAADAGPCNSYRQMRLAGAGSADQHSIALFSQKDAAHQIADQRLVDRGASEVEVLDVLGQRQLGDGPALPVAPEFRTVEGAGHFAFLAPCTPALARAAALLCSDPPGFDRVAFHRAFNSAVTRFFAARLGGLP